MMGKLWLYTFQFESANTSAPDGLVPSSGGVTMARADEGDLTATFDARVKPKVVHWGGISIVENDADVFAKVGAYTESTGVLLIYLYTNSGGTISSADTNNLTYQVLLLCNASTAGD